MASNGRANLWRGELLHEYLTDIKLEGRAVLIKDSILCENTVPKIDPKGRLGEGIHQFQTSGIQLITVAL